MDVPIDNNDIKIEIKNGSEITGALKHKTEKNVENDNITGVSFTKTKTIINGQSNPSKYRKNVLGSVTNRPVEI